MERLEDRSLLSALLSYDASGALSFQSAPNGGDVVDFSAQGGVTTITDATSDIEVTLAAGAGMVAGSGSHTVTITGVVASVVLDGNGPGATFHVLATDAPTMVTNTLGSSAAPDAVVVGNSDSAASPAGVQGIQGTVTVANVGGRTDLTVDDSADGFGRTFVKLTDHGIKGLAPADIAFDPAALRALRVDVGTGNNMITITGTVSGIVTDVNSGASDDLVTVQSVAAASVLNLNTETGRDTVDVYPTSVTPAIAGTLNLASSDHLVLDLTAVGGEAHVVDGTPTFSDVVGGGAITYPLASLDALHILYNASVTIDFSGGNPLPSKPGVVITIEIFLQGTVILRGTPPTGPFQRETVSAGGASFTDDSGTTSIGFYDRYYGDEYYYPVLYDTVPVVNCFFENGGSFYATTSVDDGPIVDGLQTARLYSNSAPPRFSATEYLANKTNLTVSTSAPRSWMNEYYNSASISLPIAPAGLATLSVRSGSGPFTTSVSATPPGIPFQAFSSTAYSDDTCVFNVTGDGIPAGIVAGVDATAGGSALPGTLNYDTGDVDATVSASEPNGVLITRPGSGSVLASGFNQIHITRTDPFPVVPVPTSFPSLKEGEAVPNVVIATFTCAAPGAKASDFTASIDYGFPGPVDIVQDVNDPSLFRVLSTLVISHAGSYDLGVTIQHHDPTSNTTVGGSLVTSAFPAVHVFNVITAAVSPLTISVLPITGTEGATRFNVPVATFTAGDYFDLNVLSNLVDAGGGATLSYSGDVTKTPGSNTYTIVIPDLTFARAGHYTLTVTATDDERGYGGVETVYSGTASFDVADAPLAAYGTYPVLTTEGKSFNGPVAYLTDPGVLVYGPPGEYTATIDWGDGSRPSAGTLTRVGETGQTFLVTGEHTYVDAGVNGGFRRFTITTTIVDQVGGSSTRATTLAEVIDVPITLTGRLDPASDHGLSQSDAITNDNRPRFFGTTEPLATVRVSVVPTGTFVPVFVGTTTADAQGGWSLATSALADGSYTVLAQSTDKAGSTTAETQILPNANQGPLVIDTTGPQVTAVSYSKAQGTLAVVFTDERSGLRTAALGETTNYGLALPSRPVFSDPLAVVVAPEPAAHPPSASVTIPIGRPFRRAPFVFLIRSGGIQDVAGNPLNGSFHGRFSPHGARYGGDFQALVRPSRVQAHRFPTPRTPR